jgi:hypothetical protein
MSLTLALSPAVEAFINERATRRDMTPEAYARSLLEAALGLPANGELPFYLTATPEEWVRRFHDMIESFKTISAPPIPPEALRRENMYEDRV